MSDLLGSLFILDRIVGCLKCVPFALPELGQLFTPGEHVASQRSLGASLSLIGAGKVRHQYSYRDSTLGDTLVILLWKKVYMSTV